MFSCINDLDDNAEDKFEKIEIEAWFVKWADEVIKNIIREIWRLWEIPIYLMIEKIINLFYK